MFGELIQEIAPVNPPYGVILLIINIIWPGMGTIINSFMGEQFNGTTLVVGLI